MLCWDDLRFFLAVARTGSTLGAGKALRVSQTTAARRVAALEAALGLALFDRRQAGYALTPAGEALVARAEEVEAAAGRFGEAASGHARGATEVVRLTTAEIYAVTILPPLLRDLHALHPGIRIELDASDDPRDLMGGEADIALRAGKSANWPASLVGRRIAGDPWTMYCSRDYAARHRRPRVARDLGEHPIIGGGGRLVWPVYRKWLDSLGLADAVAMEHGTTAGLLAAVRAGFGLAVLPSFFADRDPDLVRCLKVAEDDPMELWLLAPSHLRQVPRVRAVLDFLGARLAEMAHAPLLALEPGWAGEEPAALAAFRAGAHQV
jgi:DNA-binding transcriptional LysR family regulator